MIDIEVLRHSPDIVRKNLKKRGCDIDVGEILKKDTQRRSLQARFDTLRSEQKALSKTKPTKAMMATIGTLKREIKNTEKKMKETINDLQEMLIQLPNILHESVPEGGENDAREIEKKGDIPLFHFTTHDHETLGAKLNIIDSKKGAAVSGNRFWYLKGKAVLLEYALLRYVIDILLRHGFEPMIPPHLVREHVLFGAGFLPAAKFEIYNVNPGEDNLYLIGTSEAPLVAYHSSEIIDVSTPRRYFAFTPCYRREAGAYGKDTSGIIRGHQFDKIEMVSFTKPEHSWEEHTYLLSVEEEILTGLGLPYRVMLLASHDMSPQAAECYDIEVFLPGQGTYREVTSCSNTTDFQARRLGIRYRHKGTTDFVHTLNGTAIAMGRIIAAILENFQTEDGHVHIPEVLRSYCGFDRI